MQFGDLLGLYFTDIVQFSDLLIKEGDISLILRCENLLLRSDHVEAFMQKLQLQSINLTLVLLFLRISHLSSYFFT